MKIIGLTGGIASGKSMAAEYFKKKNIPVIDADEIARDVVKPETEGLKKIVDYFGTSILTFDGSLDRKKLRGLIFGNPAARHWLESLLHPLILSRMEEALKKLPQTHPYAIAVIPLLAETKRPTFLDHVLVIESSNELQIKRLCERDRISHELAEQMVAAQASNEKRRLLADNLVMNEGTVEDFLSALEKIHHQYALLENKRI